MNNATILRELNHVGRYSPTGAVDGDEPATEAGKRNAAAVQAWRESGNPVEVTSLPESGAIGQECGKVSGERETAAESGEISELRFRLKIAEDGWTRARFDTDAMTREIERLRDEVRRLKGEGENESVTLTVEQQVIRDGIWSERQPETLREYRRALSFAMGDN